MPSAEKLDGRIRSLSLLGSSFAKLSGLSGLEYSIADDLRRVPFRFFKG